MKNKLKIVQDYSSIISPWDYNNIISEQHVYISWADQIVKQQIKHFKDDNNLLACNVVEIWCWPWRVSDLIGSIDWVKLLWVDIDSVFLDYAKENNEVDNIKFKYHNIIQSTFSEKFHVAYSIWMHHHLEKWKDTVHYLSNVYNSLLEWWVYIVSDEFLPEYTWDEDRDIKAIIWYSHVIAQALKNWHDFLAIEEAKTLLDDLSISHNQENIKTKEQIDMVLKFVLDIDGASEKNTLAYDLHKEIIGVINYNRSDDITVDLSRWDFKISDSVFRGEIKNIWFDIIDRIDVWPVNTIGWMSVYVLKK